LWGRRGRGGEDANRPFSSSAPPGGGRARAGIAAAQVLDHGGRHRPPARAACRVGGSRRPASPPRRGPGQVLGKPRQRLPGCGARHHRCDRPLRGAPPALAPLGACRRPLRWRRNGTAQSVVRAGIHHRRSRPGGVPGDGGRAGHGCAVRSAAVEAVSDSGIQPSGPRRRHVRPGHRQRGRGGDGDAGNHAVARRPVRRSGSRRAPAAAPAPLRAARLGHDGARRQPPLQPLESRAQASGRLSSGRRPRTPADPRPGSSRAGLVDSPSSSASDSCGSSARRIRSRCLVHAVRTLARAARPHGAGTLTARERGGREMRIGVVLPIARRNGTEARRRTR
jgi:hypothetical protein